MNGSNHKLLVNKEMLLFTHLTRGNCRTCSPHPSPRSRLSPRNYRYLVPSVRSPQCLESRPERSKWAAISTWAVGVHFDSFVQVRQQQIPNSWTAAEQGSRGTELNGFSTKRRDNEIVAPLTSFTLPINGPKWHLSQINGLLSKRTFAMLSSREAIVSSIPDIWLWDRSSSFRRVNRTNKYFIVCLTGLVGHEKDSEEYEMTRGDAVGEY